MDPLADDGDLEIAELVCAWMCHALAGSIGAVLNGLELLKEDPGLAAETVSLMDDSANAASRRLKFFRAALGRPGDRPVDADAARRLLAEYLAASRSAAVAVQVDWLEGRDGAMMTPHVAQVALGLGLVASECLPRDGRITVRAAGKTIAVTATGQGARLDEATAAALALHRDGLGVRAVPAYFVARATRRLGGDLVLERATDRIEMTASPLTPIPVDDGRQRI
ncbi:MAG: histidine phosphotransferase family protein [Alphaproteobacteria bacterium]